MTDYASGVDDNEKIATHIHKSHKNLFILLSIILMVFVIIIFVLVFKHISNEKEAEMVQTAQKGFSQEVVPELQNTMQQSGLKDIQVTARYDDKLQERGDGYGIEVDLEYTSSDIDAYYTVDWGDEKLIELRDIMVSMLSVCNKYYNSYEYQGQNQPVYVWFSGNYSKDIIINSKAHEYKYAEWNKSKSLDIDGRLAYYYNGKGSSSSANQTTTNSNSNHGSSSNSTTYHSYSGSETDDPYDEGYDDIYMDDDYDTDRYASDPDYASGVDDAMEESGDDW